MLPKLFHPIKYVAKFFNFFQTRNRFLKYSDPFQIKYKIGCSLLIVFLLQFHPSTKNLFFGILHKIFDIAEI